MLLLWTVDEVDVRCCQFVVFNCSRKASNLIRRRPFSVNAPYSFSILSAGIPIFSRSRSRSPFSEPWRSQKRMFCITTASTLVTKYCTGPNTSLSTPSASRGPTTQTMSCDLASICSRVFSDESFSWLIKIGQLENAFFVGQHLLGNTPQCATSPE